MAERVDMPVEAHKPYMKPETPSAELMGKNLTFNEELKLVLNAESSLRLFKDSAIAFSKNMALEKGDGGGDIKRLKGILGESP